MPSMTRVDGISRIGLGHAEARKHDRIEELPMVGAFRASCRRRSVRRAAEAPFPGALAVEEHDIGRDDGSSADARRARGCHRPAPRPPSHSRWPRRPASGRCPRARRKAFVPPTGREKVPVLQATEHHQQEQRWRRLRKDAGEHSSQERVGEMLSRPTPRPVHRKWTSRSHRIAHVPRRSQPVAEVQGDRRASIGGFIATNFAAPCRTIGGARLRPWVQAR